MAEQDIAMNQFQIVSDAPYVYVELADGSQGKIKKSDLKLQMYKTTTIKGGDLNNVVEAGEYIVWSTVANIPAYSFYWVKVIGSTDFVQIAISFSDLKEYKRSYVNGAWTEWKSISLT